MHPILFRVPSPWGELPIYSYGVMLGSSLIFAWYFIMRVGQSRERFKKELMANCFLVTAVTALVSSRILYIVTNIDDFPTLASWFQFRTGGLVAYGGFLGGLAGSWTYLWRKGVPLAPWGDLVAPTLGSGLFFTRIGCYLYGCDFGKPLGEHAPAFLRGWGTFPRWDIDGSRLVCDATVAGSPAWSYHTSHYDLPVEAGYSLPVHPTQLYESLAGLVLFGLGLLMLKKRQYRGQVLVVLASAYAIWRFCLEYLRDDPERGGAMGFSTSQLISMAIVPACVVAHLILVKRKKEVGDSPIPASALIGGDGDEPAAAKTKTAGGKTKRKKKLKRPAKSASQRKPAD